VPVVTLLARDGARSVESGGTILEAARSGGLPLASSCGGLGLCDACRVCVVTGGENLDAKTLREDARALAADERLACQTRAHGPVTVTTTYW
jgi:ferredoxin